MKHSRLLRPGRLWLGFFGIWILFLSGAFARLGGSPGAIQWIRLQNVLSSKQAEIAELEAQLERYAEEKVLLTKNSKAQEREIRRVLGYVAEDEIVFDFTLQERAISDSDDPLERRQLSRWDIAPAVRKAL